MKILTRYVLREHVGPLLFALSALTSLLILNQIAKRFGDLVGKGLSWAVIGQFFLLSMPFIIAMTMPMAVLVAVLYAFSRLASENEVTALKASGIGIVRMIAPVLWGATVLAALMLAFNDQVLPRANHRLSTLQRDIGRKKPTFALREHVINPVSPEKLYMSTAKIDQATGTMRDVVIYDLSNPMRRRTVYADSGNMQLAANESDLQLTLHNGYSQESPRDNPAQLQRIYFVADNIVVRGVANTFSSSTQDDYKGDREMSVCEMQHSFEQRARDLVVARAEFATSMVNLSHRLATGATLPDSVVTREPSAAVPIIAPSAGGPAAAGSAARTGAFGPAPRQPGIGRLYCDYVVPLFGVRTAKAQATQTPHAPVPAPAAQQSARVITKPATPPAVVTPAAAETLRALPAVPKLPGYAGLVPRTYTPSVASEVAQLEAMRTRVSDARTGLNRFDVEIQKKFALSAACVVFVLLGAPIALRFPRGGVGLVIGVSLAVFALYYIGLIAGEALADKLILSPFWAMWAANFLLTIVGLFFLARVGKSGATARGGDMSELWEAFRGWLTRQRRRIGLSAPADGASVEAQGRTA